jgi:DNA-binding beta-propeller fold protein YncE
MTLAAMAMLCGRGYGQEGPFKVLENHKVGGPGGMDYVYADTADRKLFIPRGDHTSVYDLDSFTLLGELTPTAGVHGVAIDPESGHGFASSGEVTMFDVKTLKILSTIKLKGRPDGIFFEPFTKTVYSESHSVDNITVISPADGKIVGTIDLGGAPEQGRSDGKGHAYINLEDKNQIAVVDTKTMTCTAHWTLGEGTGPAGLAFDAETHRLFSCCGNKLMVIMNSDDGTILKTLPIGAGNDYADFDPDTKEVFASNGQGAGILTIVKENSPSDFVVEQDLPVKGGAKTCTIDMKTHHLLLITQDMMPPTPPAAAPAAPAAPATQPAPAGAGRGRGGRGGRGRPVPDSFQIIVVGKA